MQFSDDAFVHAVALLQALNAAESFRDAGSLVARHAVAIGARYFRYVELEESEFSDRGLRVLVENAPSALRFEAFRERNPELRPLAEYLMRQGYPGDSLTPVPPDLVEVRAKIMRDMLALGDARYFITSPLFRQREFSGSATYFFEHEPEDPKAMMRLVQIASQGAYQRFRELISGRDEFSGPSPLSPRQRQALELCAAGKSDFDIGVIMGITPATAHEHVETAKRRLGVKTRVQAVLAAYKNGWITV